MKKELKTLYKQNFELVRQYVNEFDPCGFIYSGAPIDEYDGLTNHLLSGLHTNKTKSELKLIILNEIEQHFGFPDLPMLESEKAEFYDDIDKLFEKLAL